jgi:hypothetical protein
MPTSLRHNHTNSVIHANIRRLRQLDKLGNANSNTGGCALVSDIAHELHKFMMIDEEVLRSALLREIGYRND